MQKKRIAVNNSAALLSLAESKTFIFSFSIIICPSVIR